MITIFKNNSVKIRFTLKDKLGNPYNVPNGHIIGFTVKKNNALDDTNIIFQKLVEGDGGNVYYFPLTGYNTNIAPGYYRYDIKEITSNYTLFTDSLLIKEVTFNGEPITGAENEIIEISNTITLINNDYSYLNNKPSINGVILIGNKTTDDLNIESEEETWELINTADFTTTGVDTVEFTVDSNNNPFELKKYRLVVELLESNGNRCHLKTTGMDNNNYFYLNAGAVALYRAGGQQVIIEPVYGYDKILDIKNTCPPPTCLYTESQAPQWLNYYTYNNAVVKSKSDLFPIDFVRIELQNTVKGKIYLYGVKE